MRTEKTGRLYEKQRIHRSEDGFILVLAMVSLVTLSLLGIWVMNSASIEQLISGNHQRYEENYQVAEGAVYSKGGDVGFTRQSWYMISNPDTLNEPLIPDANNYDPGNDIDDDVKTDQELVDDFNEDPNESRRDASLWPIGNLLEDPTDLSQDGTVNEHDYRYLVTYLYYTNAPPGTGGSFNAYRFRINSEKTVDLEIGGYKLGPAGGTSF